MSERSKVLAPLATALAVVVIAGTAALLTQDGGPGRPSPLHLAGGGREAGAPAATADAKMAGGAYTLTGSLPSGAPDDGRAYTLPRGFADEAVVAKLATALGVSAPVKGKDGWTAGGLTVSSTSGQAWWWSPCYGPDGSVSSDGTVTSPVTKDAVCSSPVTDGGGGSVGSGSAPAVGAPDAPVAAQSLPSAVVAAPPPTCSIAATSPDGTALTPEQLRAAQAGCPTMPVAPPMPAPPVVSSPPYVEAPTPSSAEVFSAAGDLLNALGLDELEGQVQTYPGGGSVTVNPKVDGLETVGLATTVQIGATGKVESANGWLSEPDAQDSYPLLSAQKAFDALPSYARLALCPVGPDGQGCTEPEPQQVTGAHLGLSVAALEQDELALLPTWLFDVKGQDYPLAGIAVEPSYLDDGPTSNPTEPSGIEPGVTEPGAVPPGDPGSTDPAPSTSVAITSWSVSKADNAVTVHYTTNGCGLTDVGADVKEDEKAVYVFLRGTGPGPEVACTEIAQDHTFEVALQTSLGAREVMDGHSGKAVPKG